MAGDSSGRTRSVSRIGNGIPRLRRSSRPRKIHAPDTRTQTFDVAEVPVYKNARILLETTPVSSATRKFGPIIFMPGQAHDDLERCVLLVVHLAIPIPGIRFKSEQPNLMNKNFSA